MVKINQYGLRRYVPTDVRTAVRKRCGFGCVVCGLAFFDYEHFDPDFKDAKFHNQNGITLLCMQHNQRRGRKTFSVETVRRANDDPFCIRRGFSNEMFDIGPEPVEVIFAGSRFYNVQHVVVIKGTPILSIQPPLEKGEPYLVSGFFSDSSGITTLEIRNNQICLSAENWDVECIGPRIIIKKDKKNIALVLRAEPPSRIVIERLSMAFEGVFLEGDSEGLKVSTDGKSWITIEGGSFSGYFAGIAVG